MRSFHSFIVNQANLGRIQLAERISHEELILCVRESFEKVIGAFPDARPELLRLCEAAVAAADPNVFRDPRPDPSPSAGKNGPGQMQQYVVNLAHSVIKATNEKFPGMRISSQFLSELFNAITKAAGKNIVDPDRGGAPMQFASTRGSDGNTAALERNWLEVPGDKNKYVFNLLLYFTKYAGDTTKAQELIRQSVDFNNLSPNYKTAVNKAINAATAQYQAGTRQPFANPLPGATPPEQVVKTAVQKKDKTPNWKKSSQSGGSPTPPTLSQNPTEDEIDETLDWYFDPNGYNKERIKTDSFGNPTIKFAGSYMPRKTIKELLLKKYQPQKPVSTDAAGVKNMIPDYTDAKGNVKVNGQSMSAQELMDRLSGKHKTDNRVNTAADLSKSLEGIPDDAMMSNPFGGGKIRKSDLEAMLRKQLG